MTRRLWCRLPPAAGLAVLLAAPPGLAADAPALCAAQDVVAVDVGHTPKRPGATSARGRTEYSYNLALGGVVLQALHAAGFGRSFIVGQAGVGQAGMNQAGADLALLDRTRIALQGRATLFISLHHDSVQPRYLQTWVVNGTTQSYSDMFHGYSVFVSNLGRDPRGSQALGRSLAAGLRQRGQTPTLHHAENIDGERRQLIDPATGLYRFDELAVLRSATMPAALIEAGVIVNREEELRVGTPAVRDAVASAIVAAVQQHSAARCGRAPGG